MTRSLLFQVGLLLLAAGIALGLGFGFLGRVHPAFDSFSHFRLHLAALLAILGLGLLVTRFRLEGTIALLLAAGAVAVTPGTPINRFVSAGAEANSQVSERPVYRLLQFNSRFDNATPEAFLSLVGRTRPDVVTMQEVSAMWRERLAPLKAAYPYQIICDGRGAIGGVAILSRRPFLEGTEPGCLGGGMFALATFDLGGATVQIAAVHLYWPWPFEQPAQVAQLSGVMAGLSEAAIVAGDFNAARWSHAVRSMAAAASMRDAGPVGVSWLTWRLPASLLPWIGLGIDHVLAGQAIAGKSIERMPRAGSDHLPILFEFSVTQNEPAPGPVVDVVDRSGQRPPTS